MRFANLITLTTDFALQDHLYVGQMKGASSFSNAHESMLLSTSKF